jgi:hypothetical protein
VKNYTCGSISVFEELSKTTETFSHSELWVGHFPNKIQKQYCYANLVGQLLPTLKHEILRPRRNKMSVSLKKSVFTCTRIVWIFPIPETNKYTCALTFSNSVHHPKSVSVCFVWFSEQTA